MRDVSGAIAYGEVATEKQSVLYCKYCLASENVLLTVSCLYLVMESGHRGATVKKKKVRRGHVQTKKLRNTGIQYI